MHPYARKYVLGAKDRKLGAEFDPNYAAVKDGRYRSMGVAKAMCWDDKSCGAWVWQKPCVGMTSLVVRGCVTTSVLTM